MNGFLQITRLKIPHNIIEFIYSHLREAGKHGLEGIGLFFGIQSDSQFEVTRALIPSHTSYQTPNGLLYVVGGDELHRINVWAYENKVSLIAQIHSHPTEAYHSGTDDDNAIVTRVGGFSIVIPDFAFGPIDIKLWEIYRLDAGGKWIHVPSESLSRIIEIV